MKTSPCCHEPVEHDDLDGPVCAGCGAKLDPEYALQERGNIVADVLLYGLWLALAAWPFTLLFVFLVVGVIAWIVK